jgi:hypothetical protein
MALTIKIITTTTTTTAKIPTHTPALKMPPITAQPAMEIIDNKNKEIVRYFCMIFGLRVKMNIETLDPKTQF